MATVQSTPSQNAEAVQPSVPAAQRARTDLIPYSLYFEHQEVGQMRCGKHALNNALGGEHFFTNEDLEAACNLVLFESMITGS